MSNPRVPEIPSDYWKEFASSEAGRAILYYRQALASYKHAKELFDEIEEQHDAVSLKMSQAEGTVESARVTLQQAEHNMLDQLARYTGK